VRAVLRRACCIEELDPAAGTHWGLALCFNTIALWEILNLLKAKAYLGASNVLQETLSLCSPRAVLFLCTHIFTSPLIITLR
jgi:hypothetical protein